MRASEMDLGPRQFVDVAALSLATAQYRPARPLVMFLRLRGIGHVQGGIERM
jgi:hypothetical protein